MKRLPFEVRLLIPVLLTCLVILSIAGILQARFIGKEFERSTRASGTMLTRFLANSAVPYITNYDLSALESFVKQLAEQQQIGYVVFYSKDGQPLTESMKEPGDLKEFISFEEPIEDSSKQLIGKVKVGYHNSELRALESDARFLSFGSSGILLVIISVVVFFFTRQAGRLLRQQSVVIRQSSEVLSSSGEDLDKVSEQLNQGAVTAATSIEETVASLKAVAEIVQENAVSAQQAESLSVQGLKVAEKGESQLQELTASINEIEEGSQKVSEIISVIDDIAFQTNLLALNASVEAARAGEQGKGFAVVADAVRSLAQKSAVAAKDIAVLIREAGEKTQKGVLTAGYSEESIKILIATVRELAEINQKISASTSEQTMQIQQISQAVELVDTVTQKNAELSEHTSANVQNTASQVGSLLEVSQQLVEFVEGKQTA